jgi:hypothetical protein
VKLRTKILAATSLTLCLAATTGCKATEPFKDAPTGARNTAPADLLTFPDGFSNAATKCDHGNRVYVIFKNNASYGSIAVVPDDPTC